MAASASSSSSSSIKKSFGLVLLVFFIFSFVSFRKVDAHPLKICKFDQIYQLGDSISDTGNLIREVPIGASTAFARPPYGETFFNHATGRCSNGLLMIDYIAMAAGLPFLPPYKKVDADFRYGANFAVAGSTALRTNVLAAKRIFSPVTNSSLDVQLEWMSNHFNSICPTHRDCVEKLQNALFMVGEIGGNDYNYAIFQGKTMDELTSMVPEVVDTIINVARRAISFGASRMVIPGNFPIGCLPIYKTAFETNISAAYDENQCLKQLNGCAMYHNKQLQQGIEKLKQENPNVVIVYGDYFSAYQFLLRYAKSYGKSQYADMIESQRRQNKLVPFETQRACCGTGGKYNFNMTRMCGAPGVPVCKDPYRYVSWDGIHLTQKGYSLMAGWLVQDIFSKLLCYF